MNEFLIGATSSNSGKTTCCLGLMRAISDRGLDVQPFKVGPDYIDPMFHQIAARRASVNLDLFLSSTRHTSQCFHRYGASADVRVVEGVMGLFDGYDKQKGSSAELAIFLDLPVIMVVNAQSAAYSVAPLVYGFKHFDPRLKLAGVIFNKVASDRHFQLLEQACNDTGTECFGYLARKTELQIPSRHLGLTISEREKTELLIRAAAEEVEKHVKIKRILDL